jgi:hypothetical protein
LDLLNVHNDLYFLANRELNFWTRAEIDSALHTASIWHYNLYYKRYFAKDQEAIDALSPFKIKHTFTDETTPKGLIDLSDEKFKYAHLLALYTVQYNSQRQQVIPQQIIIINEDELAQRLKSQMEPVTKESPIATEPGLGKIQLHPEVPNVGHVFYLKNPDAPKFEASYDGRKEEYNRNNSTQLEWSDNYVLPIIFKALQLLGVNIQSERLQQYSEIKDQQKP